MAWRSRPAQAPTSDGGDEPLPRWGAFAYPHFRRYWFANLSRVFGLQFRFIAAGWLVYELTGSAIWLGTVGLASALVTIFLSVPAGVLADRFTLRCSAIATCAASPFRVIQRRGRLTAAR